MWKEKVCFKCCLFNRFCPFSNGSNNYVSDKLLIDQKMRIKNVSVISTNKNVWQFFVPSPLKSYLSSLKTNMICHISLRMDLKNTKYQCLNKKWRMKKVSFISTFIGLQIVVFFEPYWLTKMLEIKMWIRN
jgi:hypothetical protein